MKFSPLVNRITGDAVNAWSIHFRATNMARHDKEIILLSVGEPDGDTPERVVNAAIASLYQGRTHYVPAAGEMALRQAVAGYHNRYAHKPVTANNVVIVPGAQCGLFATVLCILSSGDEVIIPEPMYPSYPGMVGATGATIVTVPLPSENHFRLSAKKVEAAITSRTRAFLLTNPHNPTGSIVNQDTLTTIAALCQEHDLWVICDEVYRTVAFDQPHVSMASIPGISKHCITISSLSKSLAMTGWRIGWIVAPEPLVEHLENLLAVMLFGSPPFIQDAAVVALEQCTDEMLALAAPYRTRRNLVCDILQTVPNLFVHKPAGGMYVMVDVRQTGLTSTEFAERLLAAQKVAVLPTDAFGASAEGHIRISLTMPDDKLAEACARIRHFCLS